MSRLETNSADYILARLGLDRDQVRRSFACEVKKMSCGRGGLPDHVVDSMYADY